MSDPEHESNKRVNIGDDADVRIGGDLIGGDKTVQRDEVNSGEDTNIVNVPPGATVNVVFDSPVPRFKPEVSFSAEAIKEFEISYLRALSKRLGELYTEGVDQITTDLTNVFVMLKTVETQSREIHSDVQATEVRTRDLGVENQGNRTVYRSQKRESASIQTPIPLSTAFQLGVAVAGSMARDGLTNLLRPLYGP